MNKHPGVYPFTIGRHSGWSLHDGTFLMPAAALARNASANELTGLLGAAQRPDGQVELCVNVMLIRWHRDLVLIDAGCGRAYGDTLGFTGARLREAGFSPADITAVVFTHLHLDHVAGALDLETRRLTFPNARHLVAADELAFWKQPVPDLVETGVAPEQVTAIVQRMHDALQIFEPRLEVFAAGDTLFEQFTAVPLPGHTPFHTGFLLSDGDDKVLNAGDVLSDARLHVPHPEWQPIGDTLPVVAVATRRALLERAAHEHLRLFCAHTSSPGFFEAIPGLLAYTQ